MRSIVISTSARRRSRARFATGSRQSRISISSTLRSGSCKLWLFVHIPCTYSLILLGIVHGDHRDALHSGGGEMQRPLDPLRFKQNRYERPNQEWVCGRAAEGRACPLGPDERGNCRATGECAPAKKGDRWFCTADRSARRQVRKGAASRMVTCSHPIPPCQPVPSLRRARGSLVWLMSCPNDRRAALSFRQQLATSLDRSRHAE